MNGKSALAVGKETFQEFGKDKAPRLAASLAYYTLFSIAPLLVIAVAIAGFVFGAEAARGEVYATLRGMVGEQGAAMVQEMIRNASKAKSGTVATVLGIATLLFGATGVFTHLKDSLNTIWGVEEQRGGGIKATILRNVFSFAMVFVVGFLLLASLLVSTALTALGRLLSSRLPGGEVLWLVLNFVISVAVIAFLFAAMFRFIPDKRLPWRDVAVGGAVTSVLFAVGKFLIALYLARSAVSSSYGAAGSLVIVLLWLYYSGLILFLGAEFTEVWARRNSGEARGETGAPATTPQPGSRPEPQRPRSLPAVPQPARTRSRAAAVAVPVAAGATGLVLGAVVGALAVTVKLVKGAGRLALAPLKHRR